MIFSELYSAYYHTVARILTAAVDHPLQPDELRRLIRDNAFGESALQMEPALTRGRWQLLLPDGSTPLQHPPTLPLTLLEQRWLRAIALDPRVQLFPGAVPDFPEVEPLFTPADIAVFDRYADGDPYTDPAYIARFRLILNAIEQQIPLRIETTNRRGLPTQMALLPDHLEYSEKDDKFRLIGTGGRYGDTVNLGRIVYCWPLEQPLRRRGKPHTPGMATVEFELYDRRNALERVLLHFAHFEKQVERLEGDTYRVTLRYDKDDQTELLIRLLSFGPMVKVTGPQRFVQLIRQRLIDQKNCEH